MVNPSQTDYVNSLKNPNIIPEEFEDGLEKSDSGMAVAKQFYNNPEPPAHARPALLDPRGNGPFLDEVEKVREEKSSSGQYLSSDTKRRLGIDQPPVADSDEEEE